jgi:hexosaminidase
MNLTKWLFFVFSVTAIARAAELSPAASNIVPRPVSVRYSTGSFHLSNRTRILADGAESRRVAALFSEFLLNQHGIHLTFASSAAASNNVISFSQKGSRGLPAEGYRLSIGPKSIRVIGQGAGLFYGMQTLTQLLPLGSSSSVDLPGLDITDYPRFRYRGVLLDVGRHFFPATYLKKYLDLLAQYKINTFHWHLTDDQGWRIEIKRYPKLTEISSRPSRFMKGSDLESYPSDEPPYGGYYTQDQIRDIVAYAKERFITIVPEIEMPGHSQAAIAAYPELACRFTQAGPDGTSEVPGNIFCPKPNTFTFLENVLTEVISLFPGPYVHIGSDEVPKDQWKLSGEAQAIIKREGLKNEDELQSFFAKHMERFLSSKGKRMIGWDEILEGGLAPNAVVMSWRGESGGIQAVRQKHEAIMSPTDYCYLDSNQGDPQREPPSIGGYLPLAKVYSYDPVPKELTSEERKYILGVQGNVWTEYISTREHLEYMVFPRLFALSEVAWSPLEGKSYDEFRRRLPYHLSRLERQGLNYRIPEPYGLKDVYTTMQDHVTVDLRPVSPGSQIYYTVDRTMPSDQSSRYQAPFEITLSENEKSFLNLIVVTPGGRHSIPYGATFFRRSCIHASANDPTEPGLKYKLFDGNFTTAKDLGQDAPTKTGVTNFIDLLQFGRLKQYGLAFEGYLRAPADGFYQFSVESDDGAVLQIDDEIVVDNDGNHSPRLVSGYIPLCQGPHKFQLKYFQGEGGATLKVMWGPVGTELTPIDGAALYQ